MDKWLHNGHESCIAVAHRRTAATSTAAATVAQMRSQIERNAVSWAKSSSILLLSICSFFLIYFSWFHGSITRDEAEHLLQPREDGLFLVRESTNFPGDYTLCVCFQGKVEHYRVKYLENKLTIDDEEYFENLGQLVAVSWSMWHPLFVWNT